MESIPKESEKNPSYPLSYEILEEKIGYHFKNPKTLVNALTHSSYSNECKCKNSHPVPYNERLEFLGDSVLGIIASEFLFFKEPKMPEGVLTKVRAKIVCENALWYAGEIDLGNFLYLGHGEELMNGRSRKSILADAFEALIAAIYIDGGKNCAQQFLLPFLLREFERDDNTVKDYKTLLQQITQQMHGEVLEYVLVGESGPDHNKVFRTEARLNSNVLGYGEGRTKRESEQAAAFEALKLFGEKI